MDVRSWSKPTVPPCRLRGDRMAASGQKRTSINAWAMPRRKGDGFNELSGGIFDIALD